MAEAFEKRRAEVDESAASVMEAIEHNESFSGRAGDPGPELVEKMAVSALKSVDLKHGGFGSQPKFPHTGAIDLLIDAATRGGENAGKSDFTPIYNYENELAILPVPGGATRNGGINPALLCRGTNIDIESEWNRCEISICGSL